MTKTKPSSLFLSVLVFLLSASPIYAVTLAGDWLSGELKLKAEQSGDNFSLIIVDTRVPKKFQGIAELKGTISGHTFTGEEFTYHPECPNLDGYRAASGNITNTKIEIIGIFFRYDTDACTLDAGTETEITGTYTKVLSPEEQARQDYLDELARFDEDLANRSGPVIDNSSATVVGTSPVAKSEKYSINVGADIRPNPSTYIDPNFYGPPANNPLPGWGKEIARISNFQGDLTIHKTYNGKAEDRQPNKVASSIKSNVLHEGDTFSFQGDGFIQYNGVDGSVKQFMTSGYAKEHGYADKTQPGQAGLEIILEPAKPVPVSPAPPGPVRKFFNWLGELLTPEPQPTPYGIVGVKG